MVELAADGSCPGGHASEAVSGRIQIEEGEPLPGFPRFNWGAFFVSPVWGVAHGLWAGVFFVPLWVFVDNAVRSTIGQAGWVRALAWATAGGTLVFQYEYARMANRLAWRRACGRMTLEAYIRRERIWGAAGAAAILVLGGWAGLYALR
jgi:hypothetical protein